MPDFNNTTGDPALSFVLTETSLRGSQTGDPALTFVLTETSSRGSQTKDPALSFVLTDTSLQGTSSGTQTSTTAVTSAVTSPPPTPSPSSDAPASPTAEVVHKPSSPTGALAGVCGGILIFAVLACLHLRRRRRRRAGYPPNPPELAPAPFTPLASENIYSPNVFRDRMDISRVDEVQHKTREDRIKLHNKSAPKPSILAPASSQSTIKKHSQRAMAPRREETVEDANLSLPGSSPEALLEEVVALRMRIRLIEGLNNHFPRPSGGRASASDSDAPPDYEDVGIPL